MAAGLVVVLVLVGERALLELLLLLSERGAEVSVRRARNGIWKRAGMGHVAVVGNVWCVGLDCGWHMKGVLQSRGAAQLGGMS